MFSLLFIACHRGWVTAEDERGWGVWSGKLLPLVWAWRGMMKNTWAMKKSSPTFCLPSSLETSTSVTKLPLKGAPPCYRTPMAGPIPLPPARAGAEGCWQRERKVIRDLVMAVLIDKGHQKRYPRLSAAVPPQARPAETGWAPGHL